MHLEKRKPVMQIDFNGSEGNIYFILAKAAELLKRAFSTDQTQRISEMRMRVMQSHSYTEALQIVGEYVAIEPSTITFR